MRKPLHQIVVFAIVLAAACGTNSATDPTRPKITIDETQSPMVAAAGPFDIQYNLAIANPSAQPITLRRVELATTGDGFYTLRRQPYFFDQIIAPGTTGAVTFWAHAIANYYPGSQNSTMPVSVRGVAIFSTPKGSIQQVFTKVLSQFGD